MRSASFGYTQDKRGFTLIELMVAISIVAILATIGLTLFSNAQKTGRDGKRRSDIDAISRALELHFNDLTCGEGAQIYCTPQDSWFAGGTLPVDPLLKRSSLTQNNDTGDSADFGYIYQPGLVLPLGHRSSPAYKVCADLEGVGSWTGKEQDYCKSNQQGG